MNQILRSEASIVELFNSFLRNHYLITQMTKREVIGRYRGSLFGLVWSFFNPLIMLAVYTLVFSSVFPAKWGVEADTKTGFALVLFVGLIAHGILAECLNNSPTLMLRHASYVKKVVFPLEILSWVVMGSTIFHAGVSVLVWLLFYLIVNQTIQWTAIFLPLVLMPLIFFSMGVSWLLASLGVYVRDIGQMTGVLATLLLFLSPIFYPASRLPEPYQTIIYLNPLTFVIEQARDVLMWGKLPDFGGIGIALFVSFLVGWAGFMWFQKTRKGFADVL